MIVLNDRCFYVPRFLSAITLEGHLHSLDPTQDASCTTYNIVATPRPISTDTLRYLSFRQEEID